MDENENLNIQADLTLKYKLWDYTAKVEFQIWLCAVKLNGSIYIGNCQSLTSNEILEFFSKAYGHQKCLKYYSAKISQSVFKIFQKVQ